VLEWGAKHGPYWYVHQRVDGHSTADVQDLVQRQFRPTAPNHVWVADISYIRTWEGGLYLAIILDAYSRKVVGWALADHMRGELATAALQMALTSRRPPAGWPRLSLGPGSQYTSSTYGEILDRYGARQSIGRPGTCWDCDYRSGAALADLTLVMTGCVPSR
jgi:putative transposase